MIVLDTNLLLRYLLNDNAAQARRVQHLLETSAQITITSTIVLELVWVLECSEYSRAEIVGALHLALAPATATLMTFDKDFASKAKRTAAFPAFADVALCPLR